ncbi:hypothetical protein IFR05_003008 [Cadophora sp. M221]|nr:hypothetical protein IFR05_003008 [Cadophora sp. M221]
MTSLIKEKAKTMPEPSIKPKKKKPLRGYFGSSSSDSQSIHVPDFSAAPKLALTDANHRSAAQVDEDKEAAEAEKRSQRLQTIEELQKELEDLESAGVTEGATIQSLLKTNSTLGGVRTNLIKELIELAEQKSG